MHGSEIHIETDVESGREGEAVLTPDQGEIAYWVEEDTIVVVTIPATAAGSKRTGQPVNVWADASGELAQLRSVQPGMPVVISTIQR